MCLINLVTVLLPDQVGATLQESGCSIIRANTKVSRYLGKGRVTVSERIWVWGLETVEDGIQE